MLKLKEEKAKDQDELLRLRELNNYRERENSEQQQRVRAIDFDLAKSQEKAIEFSKIADVKEYELRRTAEALDAAQVELARLKDENQRCLSDNISLQRQVERQAEDKNAILRQRELELQKSRELSATYYDLDARNKNKEDQLLALRKDTDQLRFSNASILERNDEFQAELAALNQHVKLLDS